MRVKRVDMLTCSGNWSLNAKCVVNRKSSGLSVIGPSNQENSAAHLLSGILSYTLEGELQIVSAPCESTFKILVSRVF